VLFNGGASSENGVLKLSVGRKKGDDGNSFAYGKENDID